MTIMTVIPNLKVRKTKKGPRTLPSPYPYETLRGPCTPPGNGPDSEGVKSPGTQSRGSDEVFHTPSGDEGNSENDEGNSENDEGNSENEEGNSENDEGNSENDEGKPN